jgi:YVTN family beta-propeller protein
MSKRASAARLAAVLGVVGLLAAACGDDTGGDSALPETTTDTALLEGPDGTEFAVTDTIPVGKFPFGVAVSADAVWVANSSDDTVSRIDPESRTVTDTIPVGDLPLGVAVSADAVWVVNRGDGTVSRIDPESLTVTDTIPVGNDGNEPTGVAVSADAVWVLNYSDGTVSRIDPESLFSD